MREWLIAILGIVLVAIVLDGIRRWRNARYTKLHMGLGMQEGLNKEDFDDYGSELPNGGARVVIRNEHKASEVNLGARENQEDSNPNFNMHQREPEQTSLDLDEDVPMLMEPMELVSREPEVALELEQEIEPESQAQFDEPSDDFPEEEQQAPRAQSVEEVVAEAPYEKAEPSLGEATPEALSGEVAQEKNSDSRFELGEDVSKPRVRKRHSSNNTNESTSTRKEPVVDNVATEKPAQSNSPEANPLANAKELLVINVLATSGQRFNGSELRDALVDSGMRYGAMKIFHRFSGSAGTGDHQFCLANVIEPGNFDLKNMDELETPGVCLLMGLPGPENALQAFDTMAETAIVLAEKLGGELKDENRSVMTKQTMEHYRQRIQDFQRKQRLAQSAMG
ncbi:MAG: cell division protein ZipA [Cellvibrionaceae bacterium]